MKSNHFLFLERMIFLAADGAAPIVDAYNLNGARKFLIVVGGSRGNGFSGWYGRILRIHILFLVVRYLERRRSVIPPALFEHKVLGQGLEGGLRDGF